MAKKIIKRPIKEILIIVGEGETEVAFINHLRSLYGVGSPKITAKSAGGKGPSNVIDDAIGTLTYSGCDRVAALLDTDLAWPKTKKDAAKKKKIILIGSNPCVEGLFIAILNKNIPETSEECKKQFLPLLDGNPTNKDSYKIIFTKSILDAARERVSELDLLIKLITGEVRWPISN